jgi:hypothetical protein
MLSVAIAANNVSIYRFGSNAARKMQKEVHRQVGCLSLKAASANIQHIGNTLC